MSNIYDRLAWLEELSVRFRPKSEEIYESVLDFTVEFENLSASERAKFVSTISDEASKKLLALSAFLAEFALSKKSVRWIKAALLVHVIEDFQKDYRENFRYLALIAHSASVLGVPIKDVLDEILPIASLRAKNGLINFFSRDDELNRLDKFGIKVSIVDGVCRFVPLK